MLNDITRMDTFWKKLESQVIWVAGKQSGNNQRFESKISKVKGKFFYSTKVFKNINFTRMISKSLSLKVQPMDSLTT